MNELHAYCDGSTRNTDPIFKGVIGWCFVVTNAAAEPGKRINGPDPSVVFRSRGVQKGRNNTEAEVAAVAQAIAWAKANGCLEGLNIHSDSLMLKGIQLLALQNPSVKFHTVQQTKYRDRIRRRKLGTPFLEPRPYLEAHAGAWKALKKYNSSRA